MNVYRIVLNSNPDKYTDIQAWTERDALRFFKNRLGDKMDISKGYVAMLVAKPQKYDFITHLSEFTVELKSSMDGVVNRIPGYSSYESALEDAKSYTEEDLDLTAYIYNYDRKLAVSVWAGEADF